MHLLHQADIFHPYEKHHSTEKDACELAEELHVKNLLLYHTEDNNISQRKELYYNEGRYGRRWTRMILTGPKQKDEKFAIMKAIYSRKLNRTR